MAEFGHFTYVFNSIGIWTYVARNGFKWGRRGVVFFFLWGGGGGAGGRGTAQVGERGSNVFFFFFWGGGGSGQCGFLLCLVRGLA